MSSFHPTTATNASQDVPIAIVLLDIIDFLDIESIFCLSKTCHSIHGLLRAREPSDEMIYGPISKIKVPYYEMGDERLWRTKDETRVTMPPVNSDASPSHPQSQVALGSLKSLSAKLLQRVHFASLKKLDFTFGSRTKYLDNSDVLVRDAFVDLAVGLGTAHNLEELHVDVGLIMMHDEFLRRMVYDIFARNLANCCKKLRKIKILNCQSGGRTRYSHGFLQALVPAIQGGAEILEEVTLLIGDSPIQMVSHEECVEVPHNLFVAILSLKRLQVFDLVINCAPSLILNNFLQACDHVYQKFGTLPSSHIIERFSVFCNLYKVPNGMAGHFPTACSLAPCLAMLGQNATGLQKFVVRVPPACWDYNSVSALKHLLSKKTRMRKLGLYFHGYECSSLCLNHILGYIQSHEDYPDNFICVSGLDCHEAITDEQEDMFSSYHNPEGENCFTWVTQDNYLLFQSRGRMIRW